MSDRDLRLAIVGHVDHGKSTIIGRMLADTKSLPEGKLEFVQENCRRNSKPFEYAFLLDALKDEQSQGITIDSARIFFNTKKRHYIIMDAPGHIEFLKNMVTGASNADAALLVIDAAEGIKENSKRHGYLLSMLGIKQIAVIVNKMDIVEYDEKVFNNIKKEFGLFLKSIDIEPISYIPASGMKGDNIAHKSENMKWYNGHTLLQMLDDFTNPPLPLEKPFRMPVQDVYKFTKDGDDRRIIAGRIESGQIKNGDEIMFLPSGKKSKIRNIEYFNGNKNGTDSAGNSTGFTLEEQIYVKRGQMAVRINEKKSHVSTLLKANVFWLGRENISVGNEYMLKLGTVKVQAIVKEIIKVIDASSLDLQKKQIVERHDVAELIFELKNEIAFDLISENPQTGRFVIVDNYEISGGGIISDLIEDKNEKVRERVLIRDEKWIASDITKNERAVRFNQKSQLIIITGEKNSGRKVLARELENKLFDEGKIVYYLGMGNVLYGVDSDIKQLNKMEPEEHIRRMAEIAYIMMDAGIILIVTALNINDDDVRLIRTITESDDIITVWKGDDISKNMEPDIHIKSNENGISKIINIMNKKGIIFSAE